MNKDILFVEYLMGYSDKVKLLHWSTPSYNMHKILDDFYGELESYKDAIAENIQSIVGDFNANQFLTLSIPSGDNPELLLSTIAKCVESWMEAHKTDMKYEGCRNASSGFLETVHKYIYLVRKQ